MSNWKLKRYEHSSHIYTNLGSSVLRSIQNETTEKMELLVRESIQNSLDAGFIHEDIRMDFTINEINKNEIFEIVQGLNKNLLNFNFKGVFQKQIVISDKNTKGLTGNTRVDLEKNSNLFKLIYNVGQPQTNEGSGGSWGYGKTIYYRIGIGLVLFYSRIKENFSYHERLVISLIEDETKNEKIVIPESKDYAGINFWGDIYTKKDTNKSTPIPITNSDQIATILDVFNIERYKNDETGTVIAIPFINEKELLESINANRKFIYDDLEDFLTTSIQRWYAPRLNNEKYIYGNKNNLIVSINNEIIQDNDQETFFKMIKEMYIYGTTGKNSKLENLFPRVSFHNDKINVNSKNIKGMNGELVGNLVYTKFHYNDIGMTNSYELKNPYSLIGMEELNNGDNNNKPILLMTRQPGMIVQYDISGSWVNGIPETSVDEYIMGIFILNSDPNVFFETDTKKQTLEEYIRSSEKADHMDWSDNTYRINNETIEPRIVDKVKNNIRNKMKNKYNSKELIDKKTNTEHLQAIFGENIMPPLNYGKAAINAPKGTTNSVANKTRNKKASINIHYNNSIYDFKVINIPFEIEIHDTSFKHIILQVSIQTEAGVLNISRFEKETGKESPISLRRINLEEKYKSREKNIQIKNKSIVKIDNSFNKQFQVGDKIEGYIIINNEDKNMVPIIRTHIEQGDKNEDI